MANDPANGRFLRFRPTGAEVEDLIARARKHPLGTDYLLHGYLDSVAATFQVHGYTVDDARRRLRSQSRKEPQS